MYHTTEKIQGMIFDWGGVFCTPAEPFASPSLQRRLSMNPNEIQMKVRQIYDDYYRGKYSGAEFWNMVIKKFSLRINKFINPAAFLNAYLSSYQIYQEMFLLLIKLKKRYRLGLLSNLTPEMRDYIQTKHYLARYFDCQVYSCDQDVGALKTEIKPFNIILTKMNLTAQNCLYIDDDAVNLQTAKSIGMKTILFDAPKNGAHKLKKLI